MKNTSFKLASVGLLAFAVSGCSSWLTDHANDYQDEKASTTSLQTPPGSLKSRDDLVIPHQNSIPDLGKEKGFTAPRAPFIFYPMAKVGVTQQADKMTFKVPADLAKTQDMIKGFLSALHGEGKVVASESDKRLVSVPFEFVKQGFWASVGSTFTRDFPKKTVFLFTFTSSGTDTVVSMQYKLQEQGDDVTGWQSPIQDPKRYTDAIRLWGDLGRKLNEATAYLSQSNENAPYPVWIDHRGIFAVRIKSPTDLANQVKDAGLHFVDGQKNVLGVNHTANNTLNQTQFQYRIEHQKAGDFLVIDVADSQNPEMTSFELAQRFVK